MRSVSFRERRNLVKETTTDGEHNTQKYNNHDKIDSSENIPDDFRNELREFEPWRRLTCITCN